MLAGCSLPQNYNCPRVAPLVTEAGRRVQRAPGVVEMTTDLTVFEVSRDELHADPTL